VASLRASVEVAQQGLRGAVCPSWRSTFWPVELTCSTTAPVGSGQGDVVLHPHRRTAWKANQISASAISIHITTMVR